MHLYNHILYLGQTFFSPQAQNSFSLSFPLIFLEYTLHSQPRQNNSSSSKWVRKLKCFFEVVI